VAVRVVAPVVVRVVVARVAAAKMGKLVAAARAAVSRSINRGASTLTA
jgi:hypothetical protein